MRRAAAVRRRERLVPLGIAVAVVLAGTAAALHYAAAGLTNSHYDARAHLVVARRVFDSLTPGWQQIGAVWLPLPHVLNMIPVQLDAWYLSGASGVALSVLSMGAAAWGLAAVVLRATGSFLAAAAGACLLMLNPNVLYLQSTPMTEPMLFGTTLAAIALTAAWIDGGVERAPTAAGIALAAACLTRYEAWPVTAAIVTIAALLVLRHGRPPAAALRAAWRLALYPAVAIALFTVNSRYTTGAWFVSNDFYVPENIEAYGAPLAAFEQVREGLHQLAGRAVIWGGCAGVLLVAVGSWRSRRASLLLLLLPLLAAGVLPWYAYLNGHPFRIRYDVPLVVACSALAAAGLAVLWRPLRVVGAVAVVALAAIATPPLDRQAPLVLEAQRDAANMEGRRAVTRYLRDHYDGRAIMMSMGSLGHYMHDLAQEGFDIRDFVHEGTTYVWDVALLDPTDFAGWIIVEEHAEGGDALFVQGRRNPRFLRHFVRVAEGGNAALYRDRRR